MKNGVPGTDGPGPMDPTRHSVHPHEWGESFYLVRQDSQVVLPSGSRPPSHPPSSRMSTTGANRRELLREVVCQ